MRLKAGWGKINNSILKEVLQCETEKLILIDMAEKYGLNDPRTIAQSRKVDGLINKIMGRMIAGMETRICPRCKRPSWSANTTGTMKCPHCEADMPPVRKKDTTPAKAGADGAVKGTEVPARR